MRFIFACFLFANLAATSVQDDMVRELDLVRYNMSLRYAPKEWKQEHLDWDLDATYEQAKQRIFDEDCTTAKDFQKIFKSFLASTQDFHVRSKYYSTEAAYFPFRVKSVDGHYYFQPLVFEFDFNELGDCLVLSGIIGLEKLPPIELGDELLAIDGVPINACVEKIIEEEFGGNPSPTAHALAEEMLFNRRGRCGDHVSGGDFSITVRHRKRNLVETYTVPWIYVPECVTNRSLPKHDPVKDFLLKDYSVRFARELKEVPNLGRKEVEDARVRSFVPELGKVLWQTEKDDKFGLYAYLYQHPCGKKVGYLHLSTFYYIDQANEVIENVKKILKFFEQKSDALVLDINGNDGGINFFTYGVLSTLANHPLRGIRHKESLIQENVYDAAFNLKGLEGIEEADIEPEVVYGYYSDKESLINLRNYASEVLSAWESGNSMTDLLYPSGIKEINPDPKVRYTKPILLLINELCFSCADLFPAILQDNGRATLFGKRTAGAGGYVRIYDHTSRFGIKAFSLTGSIAYRANGEPIENLGVTPDIPYEFTVRDLQDNYPDYVNAVNQAVHSLLFSE